MTVNQIVEALDAEIINLSAPSRVPSGVYCSDLLSWVMGHANNDNIWVTIMTNLNVLAVASLIDVACVIITENAEIDDEFVKTAKDKQINVIRCSVDSYTVCAKLSRLLDE